MNISYVQIGMQVIVLSSNMSRSEELLSLSFPLPIGKWSTVMRTEFSTLVSVSIIGNIMWIMLIATSQSSTRSKIRIFMGYGSFVDLKSILKNRDVLKSKVTAKYRVSKCCHSWRWTEPVVYPGVSKLEFVGRNLEGRSSVWEGYLLIRKLRDELVWHIVKQKWLFFSYVQHMYIFLIFSCMQNIYDFMCIVELANTLQHIKKFLLLWARSRTLWYILKIEVVGLTYFNKNPV